MGRSTVGRFRVRVTGAALVFLSAAGGAAAGESEHVAGPDGLVGWKDTYVLENGTEVAERLDIHRDGKLIRTVHGSPFIWRWMFRDEGKRIALKAGPLHFGLACVLIDIAGGQEIARLDCFAYPRNPPPGGWPSWLTELEETP